MPGHYGKKNGNGMMKPKKKIMKKKMKKK